LKRLGADVDIPVSMGVQGMFACGRDFDLAAVVRSIDAAIRCNVFGVASVVPSEW
jgi:hypothetical protein